MSGGHFGYSDLSLAEQISPDDFEDTEIHDLVIDVLHLIHEYDWYQCSDTCREDYLEAKTKFKRKWFGTPDRRLTSLVIYTNNELLKAVEHIQCAYDVMTTRIEEDKK